MFDDDTLTTATAKGFDLHAATRAAVEKSVELMLKPGEHGALVADIDLKTRTATLGYVVRVGDHVQLSGEITNVIGTKQFSGKVQILGTW